MYLIAQRIGDTGRRDLVHLAFVLGIVVEELVVCHYFCDRESDRFVFRLVHTTGHFGALHVRLADHLVALLERTLDSRVDAFDGLHLGATER